MEAAEVCVTLTKLRPVALTTPYFDRQRDRDARDTRDDGDAQSTRAIVPGPATASTACKRSWSESVGRRPVCGPTPSAIQ